jgi:hypothetical protein
MVNNKLNVINCGAKMKGVSEESTKENLWI